MIGVDTNVLVAAHRVEAPRHDRAVLWLRRLAEGSDPWGIPVPCLGEFLRICTHRRVFSPPSTTEQVGDAIDALLESPSVRLLAPTGLHWPLLKAAVDASGATGNLVFDAVIAAICREHGVERLLTEDRDFARFPSLTVVSLDREPDP